MADKNYYDILGVDRNVSESDLKKTFRKLALQYHPDKMSGKTEKEKKEAEERFKEINEAYSVLSDAEKRKMYDTYGTVDPNMMGGGFSDMDDIINMFMNSNGFSGFGGRSQKKQYKGEDKNIRVWLELEELYRGGSRSVKFSVKRPCKTCNGNGSVDGKEHECKSCHGSGYLVHTERTRFGYSQRTVECPYCNGQGYVIDKPCNKCHGSGLENVDEEINLIIPTIDKINQTFVKHSSHSCFRKKGKNGDLYIQYGVRTNDKFFVDEKNISNLYTEVNVPIIDCILGGTVKVANIDGKVLSFTIKQGTLNGEVYTINDKGFLLSNGKRGNLCVIIKTIMPKTLDSNERKVLEKLKKSNNFK